MSAPIKHSPCLRARPTGVLPWLVQVAAACLALLMASAVVFHLRRPGEMPNIAINLVLGVPALAVAVGRFVVEPF